VKISLRPLRELSLRSLREKSNAISA
jgi:hypothetical protein